MIVDITLKSYQIDGQQVFNIRYKQGDKENYTPMFKIIDNQIIGFAEKIN